jgi:sugar porter (SP) family MFS transporter
MMNIERRQSSRASRSRSSVPSWMIYTFGALGAILWGYDTGVISGALLYIKEDFAVDAASQGFITASITIGGAIGAVLSALLVDSFGRKKLILVSAVVFIIGTIIAATSPDVSQLILGRTILGVGIGFVSVNVPIYLAEIAPAAIRGRIVSMFQLMLSTGILISYLTNLAFSAQGAWQWMIGVAVVPACLMLGGVVVMPESPRWLIRRGRVDEAKQILRAREKGADVDATVLEIRESLRDARGSWRSLLEGRMRRPVAIAVLMTVLAQFLGINTIVYYAPTILTSIGLSDSASLITTVGFGVVSAGFVLVAVRVVDRSGRRTLLLVGAAVMGAAMLTIALSSTSSNISSGAVGLVVISAIVVFKIAFSCTWGPVSRVVEAEILPITVRGTGMSVAEVANFAALFVVSLTFPILLEAGAGLAYGLFALMGAIAFLVVWFLVPETKGRSLEEIERSLRRRSTRTPVGRI